MVYDCGVGAIIRPFGPADAPACGAIVEATPLWQRSGLDAVRTAALLTGASATDTVLTLEVDGAVAGFAWIDSRGVFGRSSYLRMIAVAPSQRSAGLGAHLMDAFETLAERVGPDAFLLVSDFNTDAQRFYQRRGYSEVGRIPGYVLPGVSELLMWKRLRDRA
jgi:ribosomal protein S18 acetylase RimI-like enzyme